MNHRPVLQRLIWKDIATIKPLVVVAVSTTLALNLLVFLSWQGLNGDRHNMMSWSIALWIIIPSLVTFGAPALLVGNEQESGTVNWLRTLPITWQQISAAKFWVALGAALSAWIVASFVLWLLSFGWPETHDAAASDAVEAENLFMILYYNALLLLMGFVTSYGIRSPLIGIVILIPLYAVTTILPAIVLAVWKIDDAGAWIAFPWLAGILLVMWMAGRFLARRRLLLPASHWAISFASAKPQYRRSVISLGARPSPTVSLLWQQFRQTGLLCAAIVATTFTSAFLFWHAREAVPGGLIWFLGTLSPMFLLLGASWLGASVFYGDNVRRRCGFFADRGISPSRIWWTRMAPPAIACLLMLVAIGLVAFATVEPWPQFTDIAFGYAIAVIILFAYGQLVSQWVERPVLAFLAAPAYACVTLSPAFYFIEQNHYRPHYLVLTAPVLLWATWKLTGRWLEGRTSTAFTTRVLGYTALAVMLPCVLMVSQRLLSMPILGSSSSPGRVTAVAQSEITAIAEASSAETAETAETAKRGAMP